VFYSLFDKQLFNMGGKMLTIIKYCFATLLAAGFCLQAQQVSYLKLGDAVAIALEKNYEMKVARLERISAEQNLISAKSNFRLRIDAAMDLPNASEQVEEIQVPNGLPYFNTTGSVRYQGNLYITQPLPTNGQLQLVGRTYSRNVSYWSENEKATKSRSDVLTSTSLQFNQPLLTLNTLKTNLKRANLNFESAVKRYKRDELDIVYNVTNSFFAFYRATRELQIARENVTQQEELSLLAEKKYNAGLIPEVEALQMQVDLAQSRNQLVAAESALNRVSDLFKQLIGLQFTDNVDVMTSFERPSVSVDLDQAVQYALAERTEIRLSEIQVELQKLRVKEVDAQRDFEGTLSAFYDLTGVASSDLWGTTVPRELWQRSLEDMQGRPNNRGVIFSLQAPLFDWGGNRAAVQSAKASLQMDELTLVEMRKTIEREVRDTIRRLEEAESQLSVLEQREKLAKRAFDISVARFNNGDITSQELALDRDRYITSQISYLDSYINFQLALADLKRKTVYDFEYGRSLVE